MQLKGYLVFMNDNSVAVKQLNTLKQKLSAAIHSRSQLEEASQAQSSLLVEFISKLSHVSKGIDIELDNRLATLRSSLTKSASFAEIEQQIKVISKLLQHHSKNNALNIQQMHDDFHLAGKNLQKISGLPNDLRRKLRALLNDSQESKNSLIQYMPLLGQLLSFYDAALQAKNDISKEGLLNALQNQTSNQAITKTTNAANENKNNSTIDPALIEKMSICLNGLHVSEQHTKQFLALKKKLLSDLTNEEVLKHFIDIFDLIVNDLKHERDSATNFLNSLNDTLSNVQSAVKRTLSTCNESKVKNQSINKRLQAQIIDMTGTVETAISLEKVKIDINDKMQQIADTLEKKSDLEQQQQQTLTHQLKDMSEKVQQLEKHSLLFEARLEEQRLKSLQDALTKLNNRAAFDQYFAKEMVRFYHKPFQLAVVVLDLDDFKRINDTFGHTAGDKTLQVISNTLKTKLSTNVFVARYGGEEFVLIYSDINEQALVKELTTLNKHIARLPFKFKNEKVSITVSIGATHIKDDDNIHIAFERADTALYQAKSQGKNQTVYTK